MTRKEIAETKRLAEGQLAALMIEPDGETVTVSWDWYSKARFIMRCLLNALDVETKRADEAEEKLIESGDDINAI